MGKQNASTTNKILRGIAPSDIPIESGKSQNLFINTKTPERFSIPIPSLLLEIANVVN
jgi:ABC-type uncharacterized transport system substrate-binding protein